MCQIPYIAMVGLIIGLPHQTSDRKTTTRLIKQAEQRIVNYRKRVSALPSLVADPETGIRVKERQWWTFDDNPLHGKTLTFKGRFDRFDSIDVRRFSGDDELDPGLIGVLVASIPTYMADDFEVGEVSRREGQNLQRSEKRLVELDDEIDDAKAQRKEAQRQARGERGPTVRPNRGSSGDRTDPCRPRDPNPPVTDGQREQLRKLDNEVRRQRGIDENRRNRAHTEAERLKEAEELARKEKAATRKTRGKIKRRHRERLADARHTLIIQTPEGFYAPRKLRKTIEIVARVKRTEWDRTELLPTFTIYAHLIRSEDLGWPNASPE
jgi:hypothetical protein